MAEKIKLEEAVKAELSRGKTLPITITLKGVVDYSHIKTRIEGQELIEANQRKQARGGIPDDKPYYMLTIDQAEIMAGQDITPQMMTYITQNISHKQQTDGTFNNMYYARSRSPFPPKVSCVENGQSITLADGRDKVLDGELAKGLPVIIGMQIFKGKNQIRTGISLEWVIVNGPVKYFAGGGQSASLQATLAMLGANTQAPQPVQPATPQMTPQQTTYQQPASDTIPMPVNNAMATGAARPVNQDYGSREQVPFMTPPEGDPIYTMPNQTTVPQQPVYQQPQQQQTAYQQPQPQPQPTGLRYNV